MASAIVWFEIPARDFNRARTFYETVLGIKLSVMDPGGNMAFFPADWEKGEVGGAVVARKEDAPGATGTVIYLHGGEDLSGPLGRVEAAGGKICMPKTKIPMENSGFMAFFTDTEGNKVGLHSMK